jgi:cytochrome P450
MNALDSEDACKDFINAFTSAQRGVVMPPAMRDEDWQNNCDLILSYIDNRIEEAITRVSLESKKSADELKDLRIIDELVKATDDRFSLKYLVLSIFSPAHDTVAVTLSNAFFHLARNPKVWAKLRSEILSAGSQPLTYELLNSFKYLNWVLRESKYAT